MELCCHLRWKGYDEGLSPEEVLRAAYYNNVPFRCLRTCQPWGVDDDLAAPENCVRGRACFTAPAPAAEPETDPERAEGR